MARSLLKKAIDKLDPLTRFELEEQEIEQHVKKKNAAVKQETKTFTDYTTLYQNCAGSFSLASWAKFISVDFNGTIRLFSSHPETGKSAISWFPLIGTIMEVAYKPKPDNAIKNWRDSAMSVSVFIRRYIEGNN